MAFMKLPGSPWEPDILRASNRVLRAAVMTSVRLGRGLYSKKRIHVKFEARLSPPVFEARDWSNGAVFWRTSNLALALPLTELPRGWRSFPAAALGLQIF